MFCVYLLPLLRRREKKAGSKVVEHVEARYEVQNVEVGKVYRCCPESVLIECGCGKMLALTVHRTACSKCGAAHTALTEELLDPSCPEYKVDHPCSSTSEPMINSARRCRWSSAAKRAAGREISPK